MKYNVTAFYEGDRLAEIDVEAKNKEEAIKKAKKIYSKEGTVNPSIVWFEAKKVNDFGGVF